MPVIKQFSAFFKKLQKLENQHIPVLKTTDRPSLQAFSASVGQSPAKIAINDETDTIFVSNFESQNVSVLDGTSGDVIMTMPLPEIGADLAVCKATNRLYVSNPLSNTVTILNSQTGEHISTVKVGFFPTQIAVNEQSNMAYVMNMIGNSVSIINLSNKVIHHLQLGSTPAGIVIDQTQKLLFVANRYKPTISIFTLKSVTSLPKKIGEISLADKPVRLSLESTIGVLFVQLSGSSGVATYAADTRKLISHIPEISQAVDCDVLHSEGLIFQLNLENSNVRVSDIHTGKLRKEISTEGSHSSININQISGIAYCVSSENDTVTFICPSTSQARD